MVAAAARRVAIYARFSSDKQSEASIEDQVHRARELVQRHGGDPMAAAVFTDYAVSGASMERPGIQALLSAVRRGEVELVVAESADRISRDVGDADRFRKLLDHHRVRLLCVDGTALGGSKGDALLFGVRSIFAEQYLADLADKTLRGLAGRARAGKATGGVPYGYKLVRGEGGSTIEVAESAAVVRQIFRWYAQGWGFARIARELNAEGVPPPRAHSRRTLPGWMATAVRAILTNESYRGVWTFGAREWVKAPGSGKRRPRKRTGGPLMREERPQLAIVDLATWHAVQERFAPRKGSMSARARAVYPLSGVLRCAECGGLMICCGGTPRRYACAVAQKRGECSNRATMRVSDAEDAVFEETASRLQAALPEVLEIATQEVAEWSRTRTDKHAATERQLKALEREAANVAAAIAATGALPSLLDQLRALDSRRTQLQLELARTADEAPVLPHPAELARRVACIDGLRRQDVALVRRFAETTFADGRVLCRPTTHGYVLEWSICTGAVLMKDISPGSTGLPGHTVAVAGAGFADGMPLLTCRREILGRSPV